MIRRTSRSYSAWRSATERSMARRARVSVICAGIEALVLLDSQHAFPHSKISVLERQEQAGIPRRRECSAATTTCSDRRHLRQRRTGRPRTHAPPPSATGRSPSPRSSRGRTRWPGARRRWASDAVDGWRFGARRTSTRCRSSPRWPSSGPSSCRSTVCSATTKPATSSPAHVPTWSCSRLVGLPGAWPRSSTSVRLLGVRMRCFTRRRRSPVDGLAEHDPHVVFFTSGSTGRPKGAVLSHRVNFLRSPSRCARSSRGAPWSAPIRCSTWARGPSPCSSGRRATPWCCLASATAEEIVEAVERHRATRLNCIPASGAASSTSRGPDQGALDAVRFADTGTSATPLELLDAIERDRHRRPTSGSSTARPRPAAWPSLDHADIDGSRGAAASPSPASRSGSTTTASSGSAAPSLFDGYLDDPAATDGRLVDGWYRTGDRRRRGRRGLPEHRRAGTRRDPHRRGDRGASEVEAVLPAARRGRGRRDRPARHHLGGGRLRRGGGRGRLDPPTLEDLRVHCAGRLARFKHPRDRVVDAIPRTASTGQVQRRLLVEQLASSGLRRGRDASPGRVGSRGYTSRDVYRCHQFENWCPCPDRSSRDSPSCSGPHLGCPSRTPGPTSGDPSGAVAEQRSVFLGSAIYGARAAHDRHRGPGGPARRRRRGPGRGGRGPGGPALRQLRRG